MRPTTHQPTPTDSSQRDVPVSLSIVIPVCNEAENVAALVQEINLALQRHPPYEILFVDDGSTDATGDIVRALRETQPGRIRLIEHGVRCGQSAALCTGVGVAKANWVVTLDGDGQNDPADIPALVRIATQAHANEHLLLVMGHRISRRDTWVRRLSSRIANGVRRTLLHDDTPDTGCGIKIFHRATFLTLPQFNHMHRFLPALFIRAGAKVVSMPVNHRPRLRGRSKYGINNLVRRTPQTCNVTEE